MSQIISGSLHIASSVNEMMRMLSSSHRVQHNRKITAGWILHTNRNIHTAGCETMLLIFYGTCTYCFIGKDIIQVAAVFRVKHFISRRESCFLHNSHMHLTDRNNSGKKVRSFIRVWLVKHSLVAVTGSTRFIGVNPWNDQNFVFDLFLDLAETQKIVTDSIFIVSRAWTDDCEKFI